MHSRDFQELFIFAHLAASMLREGLFEASPLCLVSTVALQGKVV